MRTVAPFVKNLSLPVIAAPMFLISGQAWLLNVVKTEL